MPEVYHSSFLLCYLYSRTLSGSLKENIKHKPKQNAKKGELGSLHYQEGCWSCIDILSQIASCVSFQEVNLYYMPKGFSLCTVYMDSRRA